MPTERAEQVKSAFSSFRKIDDAEAEKRLLGRAVEGALPEVVGPIAPLTEKVEPVPPDNVSINVGISQLPATYQIPHLQPRPMVGVEPTTQMSFRLPLSLARLLRRKARYNQLEQQEIVANALRRILPELPDPPADWES